MENLRTDLLDNYLMTDLQWKFMMMDMTVLLFFFQIVGKFRTNIKIRR